MGPGPGPMAQGPGPGGWQINPCVLLDLPTGPPPGPRARALGPWALGPGPWPLVVYYYIITPLFYIIILFIDQLYIIKARLSGADLGEPIFEILHFFENPIFSILGVDGGGGDGDGGDGRIS